MDLLDLDEETRRFMLEEIEMDAAKSDLYISEMLNPLGANAFPDLLRQAARDHDDRWLEQSLKGLFNPTFTRRNRKPGGPPVVVKMPVNAAERLAEGEFNRFYIRAVCLRALATGVVAEVYRAKAVSQPRWESEAKLGTRVDPQALLDDLRNHVGIDTALGIPAGPNSGLSIKLTVNVAVKVTTG